MPQKRSPILGKAWNFIALSFTPMGKARKPISKQFLFFNKAKRFRLLKHYNYAFIGEYEYSPSGSPLFLHASAPLKKRSCLRRLLCAGAGVESIAEGVLEDELEILSPVDDGVGWALPEPLDSGEEDDSVNQRAEKFIERFYAEMRIQREESFMQYREMPYDSCS